MTSEAAPSGSERPPTAASPVDRAELQRQREQLVALKQAGVIDEASFQRSRQIIDERMTAAAESAVPRATAVASTQAADSRSRWRFPLMVVAVALAAGVAGYGAMGQPEALFGTVKPIATAAATLPSPLAPDTSSTPVALPLDGLAERLAQRLKNEPDDVNGWMLLGRSYVNLGRQTEAVAAFQRALSLRPGDADAKTALAEAQAAQTAPGPSAGGTQGAGVAGIVTLSPELIGGVKADDTVFIFARRPEGNRMPLAILRRQVRDLPVSFELDDSHGMSPADRLSAASTVVISARVSRSGQAAPQPGDLEGSSALVALGQRNVVFEISRRLP